MCSHYPKKADKEVVHHVTQKARISPNLFERYPNTRIIYTGKCIKDGKKINIIYIQSVSKKSGEKGISQSRMGKTKYHNCISCGCAAFLDTQYCLECMKKYRKH